MQHHCYICGRAYDTSWEADRCFRRCAELARWREFVAAHPDLSFVERDRLWEQQEAAREKSE